MTAHPPKPTLTPERVQWFANYYKDQSYSWGVFSFSLADGRFCGATFTRQDKHPADLVEHARWFDTLTPSQRRRLRDKAEDLANTIVPGQQAAAR
jgi:hypothetical protein